MPAITYVHIIDLNIGEPHPKAVGHLAGEKPARPFRSPELEAVYPFSGAALIEKGCRKPVSTRRADEAFADISGLAAAAAAILRDTFKQNTAAGAQLRFPDQTAATGTAVWKYRRA